MEYALAFIIALVIALALLVTDRVIKIGNAKRQAARNAECQEFNRIEHLRTIKQLRRDRKALAGRIARLNDAIARFEYMQNNKSVFDEREALCRDLARLRDRLQVEINIYVDHYRPDAV